MYSHGQYMFSHFILHMSNNNRLFGNNFLFVSHIILGVFSFTKSNSFNICNSHYNQFCIMAIVSLLTILANCFCSNENYYIPCFFAPTSELAQFHYYKHTWSARMGGPSSAMINSNCLTLNSVGRWTRRHGHYVERPRYIM